MFVTTTRLSGVIFGDAQKNIKTFGCKDIGTYALVREPENPQDPNAIRVEVGGYFMGYIRKQIAQTLAPMMDEGRTFIAELVRRNESPRFERVGLTVRIVETTRPDRGAHEFAPGQQGGA